MNQSLSCISVLLVVHLVYAWTYLCMNIPVDQQFLKYLDQPSQHQHTVI